MNKTHFPPSFVDTPDLQHRFYSPEEISARAIAKKDKARLADIKAEARQRQADRQHKVRKFIAGTAVAAVAATHPIGQEAGSVVVETVKDAIHRVDHGFNGPDSYQEGNQGLPEDPSKMIVKVTADQDPNSSGVQQEK